MSEQAKDASEHDAAQWTVADVFEAREAVATLLAELGLDAYRFAVEPRGAGWELRVECALDCGWKETTWIVDGPTLLDSRLHADARRTLLRDWRKRLEDCKRFE